MKLLKRRSSYDFIITILEYCLSSKGVTSLYYQMKTSHQVLTHWLNITLRYDLVQREGHKFKTTDKGIRFLNKWREIQSFFKEDKG